MPNFRVLLLVSSLTIPGASAAPAETGSLPRTEHGHPDLQGVWATNFLTMLERPDGVASLVTDREGAQALVEAILGQLPTVIDPDFEIHGVDQLLRIDGQYRTSVIVDPEDGKLPFTPAGLELAGRLNNLFLNAFDDPEQRPLPERCLENLGMAPIRAIPLVLPRTFMQTRDHVLIHSEDAIGLRTIHLHGEPPAEEIRSIEGYSTGVWEGDALVVTTTHLRALSSARMVFGRSLLLSPETRIEERFRRTSDTEILYRYSVFDDGLYTQPWSGELVMTRQDTRQYEYACHEGNYSLPFSLSAGQAEQDRREDARSGATRADSEGSPTSVRLPPR